MERTFAPAPLMPLPPAPGRGASVGREALRSGRPQQPSAGPSAPRRPPKNALTRAVSMLSVRPMMATVRISLLRSIAATVAHPTITPLKALNRTDTIKAGPLSWRCWVAWKASAERPPTVSGP
jgi:hypothetical protein